jgi:hypothetical protein
MATPGTTAQEPTKDLMAREKALKEKEEALERDLKKLNIVRSGLRDFDATSVGSGQPISISEIGKGQSIEVVTDFTPKDAIDLEAFMNEIVTINVYSDGMPGALEVICPTVNGVNQPIIRGRDQKVKRKYVEALARARITNYQQDVVDSSRPENISMRPVANLAYPFTIREDRNKYGQAWLEALLRQPM